MRNEMNYYLIWTDTGWLKVPTYTCDMCLGAIHTYDTLNTTQDVRRAYMLSESQAKECLTYLQKNGVASWAVEVKADMLQDVIKELKQKTKGEANGND